MLEFVFATLLALSIILGIMQIALVFNAHHMVQLAAFNAARAAIVTRNQDSSQARGADRPAGDAAQGEARRVHHAAAGDSGPARRPADEPHQHAERDPEPPRPECGGSFGGRRPCRVRREGRGDPHGVHRDHREVRQGRSGRQGERDDRRTFRPWIRRTTTWSSTTARKGDDNLIKVIVSWNYPTGDPVRESDLLRRHQFRPWQHHQRSRPERTHVVPVGMGSLPSGLRSGESHPDGASSRWRQGSHPGAGGSVSNTRPS